MQRDNQSDHQQEEEEEETQLDENETPASTSAKEARLAKLNNLKKKMTDSLHANRRAVTSESTQSHTSASSLRHLEKLKRKADLLAEKSTHSDSEIERKKNWNYSIEDDENWERKKKRKESRGKFEFTDYDDVARRVYKKDLDRMKIDKKGYEEMKEAERERLEREGGGESLVFRDNKTFAYGDHRPNEDAVDRLVGHMNDVLDRRSKHSRVRKEEEGDITYINELNKHFNKKLERYFNKYTKEISDNFERGTAL